MRLDQIALQLWTVRNLAAVDLPGTLDAVAAAGYRAVELAGLAEVPPAELARRLDDAGLRPMAAHVGIDRMREDAAAVADRLATLTCPRAVVPWLPEEDRRDRAGVQRFAAELGSLAEGFADRGIRLGYHNHDFEFEPLGETTVWDVLLAELPRTVDLELDVYWAAAGGRDPVGEIRAAGGRIRLLHLKDRAPGDEPHDAPAGEGTLPMAAIIDAGRAAGVEWYVAEQDEPLDALADIASAFTVLERLVA